MKGKARFRFALLALVMLVMMGALIWQLSNLTLAQGAYYADLADSRRTTTTYTTGARGRILDRNGIPLAYDETSYNVQFLRDPERLGEADSALYTESLITAISIIEAGGSSTIDSFYIFQDEEAPGSYKYDWGVTSEVARLARYKNFCQAMGLTMKDSANPATWDSADTAYKKLRTMWKIPAEMPYEQARKIMSIRQEVNMNKWRAYEPITIAYNVPMEVVAQLDMQADTLMGISTIQSTTRVYPWGTTAAHLIGYLSRQVNNVSVNTLSRMGYSFTEEELADLYALDENGDVMTAEENGEEVPLVNMTKMGYSYNDYVGVAGVERTMERYLTANTTAQRGEQTIEVNKHGTVTRALEKTYAQNGNDVMLTIDLQLQTVVENALASAIQEANEKQEQRIAEDQLKEENKRKYKDPDSIRRTETGSIVVLDVHTGKTLAMASYPSFDPAKFLSPITPEDYELLFGEGSNQPTLNRAIGTRTAPGSIFKMATGLAGLMEGAITPTTTITDAGPYQHFESAPSESIDDPEDAPSCWVSPGKRGNHANLNVSGALGVSCNYFFFTVADRIGIDKLNSWAMRLGLGTSTGIELPGEITGHVGGQPVLYNYQESLDDQRSSLPYYVYRQLRKYLENIVVSYRNAEVDENAIDTCAQKLIALQDGQISGDAYGEGIRRILRDELGIPVTLTRSQNWVSGITSMLLELRWKPVMTISTGMGQGITSVTPVSVARYAATFVNGGTVYDARIVDRIIDDDGKSVQVFEPVVHDQIEAPEEYWTAIRAGLEQVISQEDGTAYSEFTEDFIKNGYRNQLIGKSGSAQISMAANIIDLEATSWFVAFLPKEDPEIVVITCIPYGISGSTGSRPAIEQITKFYIDRKNASAKENLVKLNGFVP